jgi:hypothetical protein
MTVGLGYFLVSLHFNNSLFANCLAHKVFVVLFFVFYCKQNDKITVVWLQSFFETTNLLGELLNKSSYGLENRLE